MIDEHDYNWQKEYREGKQVDREIIESSISVPGS